MAAPNPFQYLRRGVLLCGKNFATFVETFNFLVDFARNIRGDGDGNLDGLITVDRTVADRPVVRSKVNLGALRSEYSRFWTFYDNGWHNCQLQVGFNCNIKGDADSPGSGQITECDQTDDGRYYAKVNLNTETAVVELQDWNVNVKTDYTNGIVWVYVGEVENGKQKDGIYSVPVIYKFT